MNEIQLQLRQQLPESGGNHLSFAPERYYRDTKEIENDIYIQEQKKKMNDLELQELHRKDEASKLEHDRKYSWWFGYKFRRFLKIATFFTFLGIFIGIVATQLITKK